MNTENDFENVYDLMTDPEWSKYMSDNHIPMEFAIEVWRQAYIAGWKKTPQPKETFE